MVTMDHSDAMSRGAAERYALGEMEEPERDQYEEHYFGCTECADEVRAAVRFLDAVKPIARERALAGASSGAHSLVPPVAARGRRGLTALFWPMPLAAAASLVLVLGGPALYLATVKVPRLERALAEADSLQPAAWHFLSVSRAEPPTVTVSAGERRLGLTLSRSGDRSSPFYLCEVRDVGGRVVLSNVIPAAPGRDELQILVPADKLQPGAYVVAVAGLDSATNRSVAARFTEYHFTFALTNDRTPDR